MRSYVNHVTFHHPFQLPGMETTHAPGTFEVRVEEEPLDVVWEAYHRTLTFMLTSGGRTEAYQVPEEELDRLLAKDQSSIV